MSDNYKSYKFRTKAIHAGVSPAPKYKAVMTPIYMSSTFVQDEPGKYLENYDYSRAGNPTRTALEENFAALEDSKFAYAYSSGVAAADTVLRTLKSGDKVICADDVYGGTFRLFNKIFKPHGLDFSYMDLNDDKLLADCIDHQTKLIWLETPTNPLLKVFDINKVSTIAHQKGAKVIVDNTFASPYLQQPLALGADIVMHSSTKYLGGHSDLIGGALMTNDKDLAEQFFFIQKSCGAVPSPMDCFLMLRSTKTLPVRMEAHCKSAATIAQFLNSRDDIDLVRYPGLSGHPGHEIAKAQMRLFGGMISAELSGGVERAKRFFKQLNIFTLAESLGGVESLTEHPALMTHATIPPDKRAAAGITDGLVRFSVGLEDTDDLLADLEQALDNSV